MEPKVSNGTAILLREDKANYSQWFDALVGEFDTADVYYFVFPPKRGKAEGIAIPTEKDIRVATHKAKNIILQ